VDEAEFSEKILHYDIVAVGVNSQMAALAECPVQAEGSGSFLGAGCDNPVNNCPSTDRS
jgi:hypothetical protein